jgi:hypothetical protein
VVEPRKGWQARGSQANLFVSKSLGSTLLFSLRTAGRSSREDRLLGEPLTERGNPLGRMKPMRVSARLLA